MAPLQRDSVFGGRLRNVAQVFVLFCFVLFAEVCVALWLKHRMVFLWLIKRHVMKTYGGR